MYFEEKNQQALFAAIEQRNAMNFGTYFFWARVSFHNREMRRNFDQIPIES
jgi:hypothetical protein